ncbi:MAG: hypothetical protein ACKO02_11740, partial [Cyanobium sp.]
PLICDYEERLYAAGRIPGSFMRRESRPPERATLIARLIDRPMRPQAAGLWAAGAGAGSRRRLTPKTAEMLRPGCSRCGLDARIRFDKER